MMNSPHSFRFGVGPGGLNPVDSGEWADLARKAEDLGYSTLSVSDHVMHYGPFAALATAAGVTTTLRLGTLVLCNDFYHPVILAREAMTLDALSGGRLELGIGAGWMKADYDSMALGFDAPGVRIARLRESVGIVRALLRGEADAIVGSFYRVSDLEFAMRGQHAGAIPILLAGAGRQMLTLAAEEADIVGVNVNLAGGAWSNDIWGTATKETTAEKVRIIDEGSMGRNPAPERQIVSHFTLITDDRASGLEQMASAWKLPERAAAASPHGLVGTVDEIVEQLQRSRARDGFSYITVDATVIDAFAPVVAQLAGR